MRSSRLLAYVSARTASRRRDSRGWFAPSRPIPAEATAVHGIGDEDVASAPGFAELSRELLDVLDEAVFVAHNARFDLAMLQHAFA